MTIRLLSQYQDYPTNTIVTLPPDREAYLVNIGAASTTLTGGIPYVPPVVPNQVVPAGLSVRPDGSVDSIVGPNNAPVQVGAKGYSSRVANLAGGMRFTGNSMYTNGNSGIRTHCLKHEVEAPFTQVRVWCGFKRSAATPPTFTAVVAPTETMAIDTLTNAYSPIIGGTAYNALASTSYGWRTVTWAGATSATSALAPAATNSAAFMVSDWIPCVSTPRTDVVGGRPAVMLKIAQTNAAAEYTTLNGNMATYYAKRGAASYREFRFSSLAAGVDGVATLTSVPAAVPNDTSGFQMYVWLEFQYATATRSVAIVGDSTSESAGNDYGYQSWADVALRELSTQSAPVSVSNLAGSGHSHAEYLLQLDYLMTAGYLPTDIIFQGWSQNGFGNTFKGADDLIARDTTYLQKLRSAGVQVWMTTGYGVNGFNGSIEQARLKCVNQIKTWAANGLVNLVDTDAIITDYSGGNGILKAAYNSGDNVHANPAGQRAMADLLKSLWR